MYQLQRNDRVRHPSVAQTMTIVSVTDGRALCSWTDGRLSKTGVFDRQELEVAPESIKGLAVAAVRNGYAGAA